MSLRDPLPNLWPVTWTGARPLRPENADLLQAALRAVANPERCAPVRLDLGRSRIPEPEPEDKREVRSGICGRCDNRHSWRSWVGARRLYCDGCKRY